MMIRINKVIRGNLFHICEREVVVVVEFIISNINAVVVIGI